MTKALAIYLSFFAGHIVLAAIAWLMTGSWLTGAYQLSPSILFFSATGLIEIFTDRLERGMIIVGSVTIAIALVFLTIIIFYRRS